MTDKSTNDLRREIAAAEDLNIFLEENQKNFKSGSISEALNELLIHKGLSKAALAKNAGMSEVYLHQIFSGRRTPSRSRLLCLCIGGMASLDEAQEILKQCGFAQLYSANRRDAIIIYGFTHQMDLFAVNDALFSADEETLF